MFTETFTTTCYVIFKDHEEYSYSTGKSSRQFKIIHLKRFMFPEHRIFYIIYLTLNFTIKVHFTFILLRTIALISSAAKVFCSPFTSIRTWGFLFFSITLNGKYFKSLWTDLSSHVLPIIRLASKTVFSGFVVSWFFAPSPINRSPSGVKAT